MGGSISDYLFTQGILGVACIVMGIIIVVQYKSGLKKDDKIIEITDARRIDFKDTMKEVTDVLQQNSQNLRILSEKIEVGKSLERRR